jgi:hypothetical protein
MCRAVGLYRATHNSPALRIYTALWAICSRFATSLTCRQYRTSICMYAVTAAHFAPSSGDSRAFHSMSCKVERTTRSVSCAVLFRSRGTTIQLATPTASAVRRAAQSAHVLQCTYREDQNRATRLLCGSLRCLPFEFFTSLIKSHTDANNYIMMLKSRF